ncbi:MAG: acylphosphatase [Flavobacteriaceae bacterium]
MELKAYKITVKGRVQGVWFRKYTKDKADSLLLKGFVMNKPNGDVYIEVEGDNLVLNEFINWLYIGSPLCEVSEVIYTEIDIQSFDVFMVKR